MNKDLLDKLPAGWKSVKLSDVADYYDGTHQTPNYTEHGVPFVSVENINDLKGSQKYISTKDFYEYKIKPQKNDLFMTRIGEIGSVNIVKDDEPLAYYVTLALIRAHNIQPLFLMYYIQSYNFQKELNKRALLNAMPPKINLGDIGKATVFLPPLSEQKDIAKILTTADNIIAAKERLINTKQKQKKWLMQKLLTGKKRLSGFKGKWKRKPVYEYGSVLTGSTPSTTEKSNFGNDYLWVTPTDINDSIYIKNTERKLSEKGFKRSRLVKAGSILVTCIASIGKNAILPVDGSCNQQINAIKPNINYNSEFLYYLFCFNEFKLKKYAGQSATQIINKDVFQNIVFNIPPLPEQKAIAKVLTTADREIELLKKELEQQKLVKKYLMQQLLTGKIRVKGKEK